MTMHSTSSSLQLVHGAPCSTTLHRTFRARQHWHAFDARRFTARKPAPLLLLPLGALRFWPVAGAEGGACEGEVSGEDVDAIVAELAGC